MFTVVNIDLFWFKYILYVVQVRNGTCYSGPQCSELGGVASGGCAGGYGVCCIFDIGDEQYFIQIAAAVLLMALEQACMCRAF